MKTIKKLTVRVTYSVTRSNVEVPDEVYDQLASSLDEDPIDDISYDMPEAYDWLLENIEETNAMDWKVEVKCFE